MFTGLCIFKTELGWLGIVAADVWIQRTVIGHATKAQILDRLGRHYPRVPANECQRLVQRFQNYCSGRKTSLTSLKIEESWMTPFQKRVVAACRVIPWGETLTYGQLAEIAGSPRASRAVGTVMARNRYPLIVPCHRVCSNSGIGGFSAPRGIDLKRRLLANEGVMELVAV